MNEGTTSFWDRLFRDATASAWEDWLVKLVALVIVGLLGWLLKRAGRRIAPHIWSLWHNARYLRRAREAVAPDSPGLWLAPTIPPDPPARYGHQLRKSIPIVAVANLKGGVGKTTTAANLIGHFAAKGERVLAIDLDFQGSLTSFCLSEEARRQQLLLQDDGGLSKAAKLINDADAQWLMAAAESVSQLPKARCIPAFYSLASMENRVMVEWLIGKRTDDVRYGLARVLHDDLVQASFDRIVIDAPPRLTTACVQALCAATHVLIPTVLDGLSVEAVATFADQLRIHQKLWPHLRIVGVVGTMINKMPVRDGVLVDTPLTDTENDSYQAGRRALAAALDSATQPLKSTSYLPIECFIPDKAELSRAAGQRIVYPTGRPPAALLPLVEAFDRLGNEIDGRCKGTILY